MKRLEWFMMLVGALTFILPRTGFAQKSDKEELPLYWMDEIVVTATRTEKAIKDLSATVSVITREEIEASNAHSCMDILNTLPGLFVQRTGAFGRADVEIRGIGEQGRKVMVLVDGRPVKMGLFGCTVTHSLPLNNVERIEVVRGPASVLYGSDALGGVINIITRKLAESRQVDYTFSYGSYDTYQHRLRAGGSSGPLSFYATADKRQSDGHLPNAAYDGRDFTAQAGYKISDQIEAVLSSKYFEAHKEEPLRATDPDTLISDVWNDYERGAVDLTFTGKWARWNGSLKLYRNFGEHQFSDGWHSRDFTNGVMLNGTGRLFAGNELTVGADFRQQGGERLSSPPGEWDKTEVAVFFHDEQILLKKWVLTFGARANHDEFAGNEFCPQVGLVFHPRTGTTLRTSVNKGFRAPQINELYLFPPSNTGLKSEEVWNTEVGLTQRIVEGVDVNLAAYQMKGKNLIQTEKNAMPPPRFLFRNTGEFEFKGIEAGVRARIGNTVSARMSYTYLDPGAKTAGRPGDKVDLGVRATRGKLTLSLDAQYVADYFAADDRNDPVSDYLASDVKLSYEILPALQLFLAVDNVLDKAYEIYADLPGGAAGLYAMPKRTFTTGLTFQL
ncbi:MAG: TonB-dependent receptor [Candidatus Latescibacteria bacterium]|nr:TonB-dependent receptor [Candidatus Latescibacterota bacterium]